MIVQAPLKVKEWTSIYLSSNRAYKMHCKLLFGTKSKVCVLRWDGLLFHFFYLQLDPITYYYFFKEFIQIKSFYAILCTFLQRIRSGVGFYQNLFQIFSWYDEAVHEVNPSDQTNKLWSELYILWVSTFYTPSPLTGTDGKYLYSIQYNLNPLFNPLTRNHARPQYFLLFY